MSTQFMHGFHMEETFSHCLEHDRQTELVTVSQGCRAKGKTQDKDQIIF